jgi:acyl-CoA synthetase (NDP forming)
MKIRIGKSAKVSLIENIISSLDDLYDELSYDNNEKEIECIKSKIKIREDFLNKI